MKIGILIAELSPYGAERATVCLAEGLKAHGHDVSILLTDTSTGRELSVPVISMMNGRKPSLFEKFLYAPLQYVRLRRAIEERQFDVLISVLERSNIFNLMLPHSHLKVLTVSTFLRTGFRVNGFWRRVSTRILYRALLERSDLIVAVSQVVHDDFKTLFPVSPRKLAVLGNPLDLEAISALAQEDLELAHRALLDGNSILHVGRFTRDKGQWAVIRALPRILEAVPDARLLLLGDGDLRPYLEQLVTSLTLRDKVHFLGYQSNPVKFMSRTKLLVASSTREGLPNALIEALACRTPVVSTDCKAGPRELLAPTTPVSAVARDVEQADYGLLVPPLDSRPKRAREPLDSSEECLSRAVVRMLQDESLREHYKLRGPGRVDEFKVESIVPRWLDLLSQSAERSELVTPERSTTIS